jgi:hypothetical protein
MGNPNNPLMKRMIIICEGQTEQEFCKDVLLPHLQSKNIGS